MAISAQVGVKWSRWVKAKALCKEESREHQVCRVSESEVGAPEPSRGQAGGQARVSSRGSNRDQRVKPQAGGGGQGGSSRGQKPGSGVTFVCLTRGHTHSAQA